MNAFLGELIGTAILILLGNGVVANVVLSGTKAHGAGWIVIAWGWGMAVFVAVFTVAAFSGAHINPAVTLGLAIAGKFAWADAPAYVAAQFIGATIGAMLVWAVYKDHFARTEDADLKLAVFCTGPAIRNTASNLISEIVGAFVLVFAVLFLAVAVFGLGGLDALPVGLLVLAIGLSLGGTTGYAINPARDLAPRVVHAILPIPGKRDSDWRYAWIPVVGPVIGATLAALTYLLLQDPLDVNFR
ncbi:MIP/aquaporin family protein [Rubrimonas sp.]|uniref:MIP/aquaporin family protein n=1 Tax=Rubrimonas sp. TaxID=2036015 RepID=UPI002FDEB44B